MGKCYSLPLLRRPSTTSSRRSSKVDADVNTTEHVESEDRGEDKSVHEVVRNQVDEPAQQHGAAQGENMVRGFDLPIQAFDEDEMKIDDEQHNELVLELVAGLQRKDDRNVIVIKSNGEFVQQPRLDEAVEVINVVYLFASPLTPGVELLNSNEEIKCLLEVLRKVAKKAKVVISFQALVATSHNRLETLQNRPTILYIASHCNKNDGALVMEDSDGSHVLWAANLIQDYFTTTSDNKPPIQCAIIGACFSEEFAKLFMKHGNIRHVVTVKKSQRVSDGAMATFVRVFLDKVLQAMSVHQAFQWTTISLKDDQYPYEAGNFLLYQQEGFENGKLSFKTGIAGGEVRDDSPKYQFQCQQLPAHYINQDVGKLSSLYTFFVRNRRALGVLQAPRGYGSTTTAIRLAYHLAPRRVFHGIYYIPLEAYVQEKGIKHCKERDVVRCVVESLQKNMPGLDSCENLRDLISAVTGNLHEKCEVNDDRLKRILFIFDGCCVGRQGTFENTAFELQTTVIANLICQLLTLAESVSVLAICHKHVVFPLHDGRIVQNSIQLDPMSDVDIASLLLEDSAREISFDEIINDGQRGQLTGDVNNFSIQAMKIVSQSPIVRELQGMPAAARIFSQYVHHKSLKNVEFYVELAKQSVAYAKEIKRPFQTDYTLVHRNILKGSHEPNPPESPRSPEQIIRQISNISTVYVTDAEPSSLDEVSSSWSRGNAVSPASNYNRGRSTSCNTKGGFATSSCESNSTNLKSVGCEDDAVSSPRYDATKNSGVVTSSQTMPCHTMQSCDFGLNWDGFLEAFYLALHKGRVANPQKLDKRDFFDLASYKQHNSTKYNRIYNNVLDLAEACPVIFGGSAPLVHFYSRNVAERKLNSKGLRPGNCLLCMSEDHPQLILLWIVLEGGENTLKTVGVAVIAGPTGPTFRCGSKVYNDLISMIREQGGGSLSYLCPNIPIDGNGNPENRRLWKSEQNTQNYK